MDFSLEGISSNPLFALVNPAAIPAVAGSMILDRNPDMFKGLFDGLKTKSTPIDYKSVLRSGEPDSNQKYYIIAAVIVVIIIVVGFMRKK